MICFWAEVLCVYVAGLVCGGYYTQREGGGIGGNEPHLDCNREINYVFNVFNL